MTESKSEKTAEQLCHKQLKKMEAKQQKLFNEIIEMEKKKDMNTRKTQDYKLKLIKKLQNRKQKVDKYFNIEYCRNLVDKAPIIMITKGDTTICSPDLKLAKNYWSKFYTELTNGCYLVKNGNDYEIQSKETVKGIFDKLGKTMSNWIRKDNTNICEVIIDVDLEPGRIPETNYVNTFGGFLHSSKRKSFQDYPEDVKKCVHEMNKYVLEVLANNNQTNYNYTINWYANVAQGFKNSSALYFKGPQGIGKSFYNDFFQKFVIGNKICVKLGDAYTLTEKFNSILMGKVFVRYEELPTFSQNQWMAVSGVMKDRVTSHESRYEGKGTNAIVAVNLNNYVIISNVEALQDQEGRRYFILELSTIRMGDHEYFQKLNDMCCNDIVGEAYYNYLCDIDLRGFDAQMSMPVNEKKKESLVANLPHEYKFIKGTFILPQINMNHTLNELIEMYQTYCKENISENYKFHQAVKWKLNDKLKEIQLTLNGKSGEKGRLFKYSHAELRDIFDKKGWIHELDIEEYNEKKYKKVKLPNGLDHFTSDKEEELSEKILFLEEKIKSLQTSSKDYEYRCKYVESNNNNEQLQKRIIQVNEDWAFNESALDEKYNDLKRKNQILKDKLKAKDEYIEHLYNQIDILVGNKKHQEPCISDNEEPDDDSIELLDRIDATIGIVDSLLKCQIEKREETEKYIDEIMKPFRQLKKVNVEEECDEALMAFCYICKKLFSPTGLDKCNKCRDAIRQKKKQEIVDRSEPSDEENIAPSPPKKQPIEQKPEKPKTVCITTKQKLPEKKQYVPFYKKKPIQSTTIKELDSDVDSDSDLDGLIDLCH